MGNVNNGENINENKIKINKENDKEIINTFTDKENNSIYNQDYKNDNINNVNENIIEIENNIQKNIILEKVLNHNNQNQNNSNSITNQTSQINNITIINQNNINNISIYNNSSTQLSTDNIFNLKNKNNNIIELPNSFLLKKTNKNFISLSPSRFSHASFLPFSPSLYSNSDYSELNSEFLSTVDLGQKHYNLKLSPKNNYREGLEKDIELDILYKNKSYKEVKEKIFKETKIITINPGQIIKPKIKTKRKLKPIKKILTCKDGKKILWEENTVLTTITENQIMDKQKYDDNYPLDVEFVKQNITKIYNIEIIKNPYLSIEDKEN